jgi:hypothetical protein
MTGGQAGISNRTEEDETEQHEKTHLIAIHPALWSPSMLVLTDNQMAQIFRAAAPLSPPDRENFMRDVAAELDGKIIGDGSVQRVCREVQRRYFRPPDGHSHGPQHRAKFHRPAEAEPVA